METVNEAREFVEKNLGKTFIHSGFKKVVVCGYSIQEGLVYNVIVSPLEDVKDGWTLLNSYDIIKKKSKRGYYYVKIESLTSQISFWKRVKQFFDRQFKA